ncbi:MAG: hypothetical protein QOJ29_4199 [Thermoleophilaceae bacterium]|jgi:hypothetical protein|nr:hypothetical protein [Thermoleophilaceae bacterium]
MSEKQAQLEWEARAGRLAAAVAWLAAVVIIAAVAYRIAVLPHGASNVREFLPEVKAHKNAFLVSGIVTAIGMMAFIPPLVFLYNATRFRRQELPPVARILAIAGPILFAICAVWFQFRQAHAADQFVAGTVKTTKHAEDLLRNSTTAVAGLSLGASIASGLATILISLNAMRAGLLSRFMGVMGIILGALFVLPLIASPIIQLFWLIALGALFVGAWPGGGRGPAWESGEAIPWPSAQERFAPPADADPESEPEPEPEPAPNPRAARKRKKKKARR